MASVMRKERGDDLGIEYDTKMVVLDTTHRIDVDNNLKAFSREVLKLTPYCPKEKMPEHTVVQNVTIANLFLV